MQQRHGRAAETVGIIEWVDASPCISNQVLVKKSGSLSPCVDLRQVDHKVVITDKYPLLMVEELSARVTCEFPYIKAAATSLPL